MDISKLLTQPHHMNAGGAASFLEGFASELASVGHTSLTISGYLSSAIQVGGCKPGACISWILMTIPSRHSEHITANVLEAITINRFREPSQHVFSASPSISDNSASSERLLILRAKPLRP
jgi:hypothetical protein